MSAGRSGRWLLLWGILQFTAGCSYVKSLFPDKERDYQFRSEIPELIIPDDLKGPKMPGLPVAGRRPEPEPVVTAATENAPPSRPLPAPVPAPAPTQVAARVQAEAAQPSVPANPETSGPAPATRAAAGRADVSSLQVDQSKNQAWRLVARALSRQKIEIVERNQDRGYFFIRYDPYAIAPENSGFWSELDFIFGRDPSQEQEYRVSLQEISAMLTEVTVQNNEGQTLSDLTATHLLKLITDGINMDAPAAAPEQPAVEQPASEQPAP